MPAGYETVETKAGPKKMRYLSKADVAEETGDVYGYTPGRSKKARKDVASL